MTSETNYDESFESFDPALKKAFQTNTDVPKEIKNPSAFKIQKDKIKLSGDGTFFTFQGEGPTLGKPCVFTRLHVCNLRCSWCDAWYTWNPNTKEYWTKPDDVSFEECRDKIVKRWPRISDRFKKRVVWTGGEPLIQRKQIDEVIRLLGDDWTNEVETNGTLMPTENQLERCQFNCSPKLSNSDNHDHSMVKPKVLAALNEVNTAFKFVAQDEQDLDEIEEKYLPHIDEDKILIMPEGIVEEEITKHARELYEPCMERGWAMTPRFQAIFADGARRGV